MEWNIIYEDTDLLVIHKPAGLATQTNKVGQQDVVSLVKNHMANKEKYGAPYVALINRLDQPVEGLVLLGKNDRAARVLSEQIQKNQIQKCYYAVTFQEPERSEDTLVDFMIKDGKTNLSRIIKTPAEGPISRDAKRAELSYKHLYTVENSLEMGMECVKYITSLMDIRLKTGRHHQIRVQMANAGMPLVGDLKYGTAESMALSRKINQKGIALCAYSLSFTHPATGKKVTFSIEPQGTLFQKMRSTSI